MPVQDEVPKSRITLTYETEVNGEPAPVELPLRHMVLADLSLGTSSDRKIDLDERAPRNFNGSNTDEIMEQMGTSLEMVVPNKISPNEEESIRVKIPINGVDSFSPEKVAEEVPQVKSLLLFKKLLEEIQSNIANKKEFAQLLSKLYSNPEALQKIKEETKDVSPKLPKIEVEIVDEKNKEE